MAEKDAKQDCIFCNIISGKNPDAKFVYRDEDVVVIHDKFPLAKHHLLVLPTRHIDSAKQLQPSDLPLVEKMNKIGLEKIQELGADMDDLRSGINWPPLNTVKHLHQHFISPGSSMGAVRGFFFSQRNWWFVNTAYLLKRLGK